MASAKAKKRTKRAFIVIGIILAVLAAVVLVFSLVSVIGNDANLKKAENFAKVVKEDALPAPMIDPETGYYTFVADRDFVVLQLTDVHIGGGCLSLGKDGKAMDAVYDLVSYVKPDLVIVSGDISFPVPYASGSFNNLPAVKIFAQMMESAGVYWTFAFGNHDTEVYSFYSREEICDYYADAGYKYCLFRPGPDDVDGYGNDIINVKNSQNIITQSLVMFDSHSYVKGFYQDYDNIHPNQVVWYENEITRLDNINKANGATDTLKSLAFFHIPLREYKDAYTEWNNNGQQDTANVKYKYGIAGETGNVVYHGINDDEVFETMMRLGSTQGIFCGHDHYNNFSMDYNGGSGDKYIRITYGMSIDYLAYFGIAKKTAQRGGTVITVFEDGSFDNYGLRMIDHKEIHVKGDY